jgi:chromosome segregation ATPase
MIGLRAELLRTRQQNGELENGASQQGREIQELCNEIAREQSEKVGMKAMIDEQRRKNGKLEGDIQRDEETIGRQASEIEHLKAAQKKYKVFNPPPSISVSR